MILCHLQLAVTNNKDENLVIFVTNYTMPKCGIYDYTHDYMTMLSIWTCHLSTRFFLSKSYLQFAHMTTILYTILYYQDCTSLIVGLTNYKIIYVIYIYLLSPSTCPCDSMCQCLVEHRMFSLLRLHPHFNLPHMFMTKSNMTRH
jgi:hypothetical protein